MRLPPLLPTALYGAASAGGVLFAGTHAIGVGWNQAYGPANGVYTGLLGGAAIAALVLPVWVVRASVWRLAREWPHLLVPPVLAVLVPVGIAAGGRWQDPWETTVCWVVVALGVHLATALLIRPDTSATTYTVTGTALLLLVAAAVGAEHLAEARWLSRAVARAHVPLVVPVAAGYTPAAVGLGDYTLVVRMRAADGRTFDVAIERARLGDACTAHWSCTLGASAVAWDSQGPDAFTLRPAGAAELVRLPRITIQGVEPD